MDIDGEKLEQAVLALLYLNSFEEGEGKRAWKSFPWSVMDSLHEKGYISDPATKNKSVWLSEKGAKLSEKLFEKLFAVKKGKQVQHAATGSSSAVDSKSRTTALPFATIGAPASSAVSRRELVTL